MREYDSVTVFFLKMACDEKKSITVLPKCVENLCLVRMMNKERLIKLTSISAGSVILNDLGRMVSESELRSNLLDWLSFIESDNSLSSTKDFLNFYLGLRDGLDELDL
jgi:hypothetical protein